MKMNHKATSIIGHKPPRVTFFSGKGGVGKTTLAGTAALHLASRGARVLTASTDPAHSLGDLFDAPIGNEVCAVAPGIDAVEVDAPETMGEAVDTLESQKSTAMGIASELMKLASHAPGIDEIVSLDLLLRLIEQPAYDEVVLDTAPTGHTLRLLALPDLMAGYFGKLLAVGGQLGRLGKKLRSLFKSNSRDDNKDIGEELDGARERMMMLGEVLRDPARSSLILVTIPEAMSMLETARTIDLLGEQGIPVTALAVNMIQPQAPDCSFCTERRQTHLKMLEAIQKLAPETPLITVEQEIKEPRGPDPLRHLAKKIWQDQHEILLRPPTYDAW